jgi:acetyl esterase/lipase
MKKIIPILFLIFSFSLNAQVRYLDEMFTSADVTPDVMYGSNVTIITGAPTLDTMTMDIYEPSGDTLTARPLVIYIHTGSFLPVPVNGQCTGDKSDSATVEMCMRLAKKGYVVAAVNYRLGWNPLGNQDERTGTLINAVYRALQDMKSCVRYFRMTAATMGNPYRIDDTRIALGGQGSGGYVALA